MIPECICKLCHVIFGMLTVWSSFAHPVLVGIFFLTFVLYELDEEWNNGDHAFEEMREYGIGLALGLLVVMLL